MITAPSDDDIKRLTKSFITASDLVQTHVGATLDGSDADLEKIQSLLDLNILDRSRRYELQCLGVALGRVLITQGDGLDWAIIEDEYGRDPTVRYQESTLTFNVVTMISKRVERGEPVGVRKLFNLVWNNLDSLKGNVD